MRGAQLHITAQGPRLRNDLYCVEWDVKLHYTIPYHTRPIIHCWTMPVQTANIYTGLAASYIAVYRMYRSTFTSEVAYCVLNDMSNPVTDIV